MPEDIHFHSGERLSADKLNDLVKAASRKVGTGNFSDGDAIVINGGNGFPAEQGTFIVSGQAGVGGPHPMLEYCLWDRSQPPVLLGYKCVWVPYDEETEEGGYYEVDEIERGRVGYYHLRYPTAERDAEGNYTGWPYSLGTEPMQQYLENVPASCEVCDALSDETATDSAWGVSCNPLLVHAWKDPDTGWWLIWDDEPRQSQLYTEFYFLSAIVNTSCLPELRSLVRSQLVEGGTVYNNAYYRMNDSIGSQYFIYTDVTDPDAWPVKGEYLIEILLSPYGLPKDEIEYYGYEATLYQFKIPYNATAEDIKQIIHDDTVAYDPDTGEELYSYFTSNVDIQSPPDLTDVWHISDHNDIPAEESIVTDKNGWRPRPIYFNFRGACFNVPSVRDSTVYDGQRVYPQMRIVQQKMMDKDNKSASIYSLHCISLGQQEVNSYYQADSDTVVNYWVGDNGMHAKDVTENCMTDYFVDFWWAAGVKQGLTNSWDATTYYTNILWWAQYCNSYWILVKQELGDTGMPLWPTDASIIITIKLSATKSVTTRKIKLSEGAESIKVAIKRALKGYSVWVGVTGYYIALSPYGPVQGFHSLAVQSFNTDDRDIIWFQWNEKASLTTYVYRDHPVKHCRHCDSSGDCTPVTDCGEDGGCQPTDCTTGDCGSSCDACDEEDECPSCDSTDCVCDVACDACELGCQGGCDSCDACNAANDCSIVTDCSIATEQCATDLCETECPVAECNNECALDCNSCLAGADCSGGDAKCAPYDFCKLSCQVSCDVGGDTACQSGDGCTSAKDNCPADCNSCLTSDGTQCTSCVTNCDPELCTPQDCSLMCQGAGDICTVCDNVSEIPCDDCGNSDYCGWCDIHCETTDCGNNDGCFGEPADCAVIDVCAFDCKGNCDILCDLDICIHADCATMCQEGCDVVCQIQADQ